MLDVARWLAEQGLGHDAEALAANGVGGDVVCDLTDDDLRELGLNLGDRKCLYGAHAALPHFIEQGEGVLINNVSIGGFVATPYAASYAASKFGVRAFSNTCARS